MARAPLPWDPSDTRGIDADPSCLHHALALAYHFHLLIQWSPHKDTEDIDVYEIFLRLLSVTALKPLGGAMAQWRKRAGEHPRVDARDARGTNR